MSLHLLRDLDHLKREILTMGAMVEESINKAIAALLDGRAEVGREVVDGDNVIDHKEVQIEEECLKVLALHQPVAADLRFIIVVLKVNNDLERMGDLAVNIAERAENMSVIQSHAGAPVDLTEMVRRVRSMVRDSLDALVKLDGGLARLVRKDDDNVDRLHRQIFQTLQEKMQADPEGIPTALNFLSAARQLERIADLATNIAEDVVFMVDGEVIRHTHP